MNGIHKEIAYPQKQSPIDRLSHCYNAILAVSGMQESDQELSHQLFAG